MLLELPVGMAAPYFVTQADRSIACVAEPAMLIAREPMGLDTLAHFLAFLAEEPTKPTRNPRWWFGRNETPKPRASALERARTMLRAITVGNRWPRPEESVATRHPVFVLANTLDAATLQALSVLKLRGYVATLAIDVAPCTGLLPALMRMLDEDAPGHAPPFADPFKIAAGYGAIRELTVIAGRKATVFSNTLAADEILGRYPDLAGGS